MSRVSFGGGMEEKAWQARRKAWGLEAPGQEPEGSPA